MKKRPAGPRAEHPTSVAVVRPVFGRRGCYGWRYRDQRNSGSDESAVYPDRGQAVAAAFAAGFGHVVVDASR